MTNPTRVNLSSATIDTVDAAALVEFDPSFTTTDNHEVEQCDPSRTLLPRETRMYDFSIDQAMTVLHALPLDTVLRLRTTRNLTLS